MLSRRLLRIKVVQLLYAYFQTDSGSVDKLEKELFHSINKAYELYHYLLLLILDVSIYAESRIELKRQKRVPTFEDLNPSTRFIENRVIQQIRENNALNRYLGNLGLSWVNYPELVKKIYLAMLDRDYYKRYLSAPTCSYEDDKRLIVKIYEEEIAGTELLYQILEEQSIYWNDDVEFVISMIIKTLRKMKPNDGPEMPLMELYKNEEDREFTRELFRKSITRSKELRQIVDQHTKNWDVERIAFMDILIMQVALTEIIEFSAIPTKVSLNEYIEIAKFYSTEKSGIFVNGILDRIVSKFREDKVFVKKGRGLIGEN